MSFLPIVERELRAAARQPATYRTRTWCVIVTSLMAAGLVLLGDLTAPGTGNPVFPALATLAFLYCLVAGARYAADALSEEKREGTLGLLFLTDLRGYDIVLGKLVAVSARTFQGLFAFFPVLAIGLVMGGITNGEFWRAAASLSNALFFSLCVSLWVSSLSRTAHAALAGSAALLVFLTVTGQGVDWLLGQVWPNSPLGLLRIVSPGGAALYATDAAYQMRPERFWQGLLLNHLLGWCFLALASVATPHSWQDRPVAVRDTEAEPREGKGASRPARPARSAQRRDLLDSNPIVWLAGRQASQARLLWIIIGLGSCAAGVMFAISVWVGGSSFAFSSIVVFGLKLVLKLWVAWQACVTLAEARRTGAVELLLATPLRVDEIIRGHWQALQNMFLGPAVAVLLLSLLPAAEAYARDWPSASNFYMFPISVMTLFEMATYAFDLAALAWTGMWMGLSQPKLLQAYGKTVLFVIVVPALAFCFPNVLFDLFFIAWARRKLEHSFRQAAAGRYEPTEAAAAFPSGGAALPPVIPQQSV